ncbi:linear amide C-N hydrolase [Natronospora cellulosivora (SeqCode)]
MCSEFLLPGQKNIKISGRTMDWADDFQSAFVVVPRNKKVYSLLDGDKKNPFKEGMCWKSDYGYVGINVYNLPIYFDGINEKGLSAALLALLDTEYPEPDQDIQKNISIIFLLQYVLGKCKDVEDIRNFIDQVTICNLTLGLPIRKNVHFIAHDANGDSIVLEAEGGQIKEYHNEDAAVMTNSPFLHWHLKNMRNYCNLTNETLSFGSRVPFSAGSGMLGLPGDPLPPSRYVRLSLLRNYSPVSQNVNEEIQQAFHIINNVALVNGQKKPGDHTQWEVVRDHINKRYYYRSNQNQSVRFIDLKKIDFSGHTQYTPIPVTKGNLYEDVTTRFINN